MKRKKGLTRLAFIKSCAVAVAAVFLPMPKIKEKGLDVEAVKRFREDIEWKDHRNNMGMATVAQINLEEILNAPLRGEEYPLKFRQYEEIKKAFELQSMWTGDE